MALFADCGLTLLPILQNSKLSISFNTAIAPFHAPIAIAPYIKSDPSTLRASLHSERSPHCATHNWVVGNPIGYELELGTSNLA
ncbi:hypothetical protein H6G89_03680 [Oscillatoria sp. FACHB-1407]|uniref:hypothetical protein n=1 Tax=Oscillatoria sp. FACHB-1407 TaxID=2692847 RepID=UPI00168772DD|nr:hypothetical protein [Oscillatoria sp. FACHB-1407]MBD2460139.1 hypothetical protein [Oscillatoria sp. FACHB-1407]